MTLFPASLRWRLLLLSLLVVLPALLWLGWQLSEEFEASVERRVHRELENHMNQLLARVRALPDGRLAVSGQLSDPRFNVPLSGLYWQIDDARKGPLLRSRSLWDSVLAITPSMLRGGGVTEYTLKGPRGEELFVLLRGVWIDLPAASGKPDSTTPSATSRRYIFAVALDHGEISAAVHEFNRHIRFGLLLLAGILAVMLLAQILWGLQPLKQLHRHLEDVRHGRRRSLPGAGIRELQPLVEELNSLLTAHEKQVEKARARAANLAHGMKTPLAVLAALARRLQQRNLRAEAEEMDEQIRQLSRHIEHELARSKIHGGKGRITPHTAAARPLAGIVQALRPLNEHLHWQLDVPPDIRVPMEKGDFMELAGNLLENAAKWARKRVIVRLYADIHQRLCLVVEDDGPGVPPDRYDAILQRGVRLDESVHGTGLGLAIVSDILKSYNYSLHFYRAEIGGLGVCVIFAAPAQQEDAPRTTSGNGEDERGTILPFRPAARR